MMSKEEMIDSGRIAVERRSMLKRAGFSYAGAVAVAALANGALGSAPADAASIVYPPTSGPTAMDINILNFALNLEYLDSTYYHIALLGTPLSAADMASGTGVAGAAPLMTGAHAVSFDTPIVRQFAQTFAADEQAHVAYLRSPANLGTSAIGMPLIDLSVGPASAFNMVALNAGYIQPGQVFDPYANENEFLVGAYIFEDVAATAYAGAAALLSMGSELVQYAASLMSTEAYHAGCIRTLLAIRGGGAATDGISTVRSMLSSGAAPGSTFGDDFGTLDPVSGDVLLLPTDASALLYRRSVNQILNIVYGNSTGVTFTNGIPSGHGTPGLFYPNGFNTLPGVAGFS